MEGSLPIPDEKIQTFQTFKRILDGNSIGAQDITMDLFKFADKFNIQPLVKACGDYFAKNINKENMFKLAIIANRVEDGYLMKKLVVHLRASFLVNGAFGLLGAVETRRIKKIKIVYINH